MAWVIMDRNLDLASVITTPLSWLLYSGFAVLKEIPCRIGGSSGTSWLWMVWRMPPACRQTDSRLCCIGGR
jgi:hypothetical protein